jgi:hypothetical protein
LDIQALQELTNAGHFQTQQQKESMNVGELRAKDLAF